MQAARAAIDLVLSGYEPFPALAVDRHWTLVSANRTVGLLLAGVDPALLTPPVNVLRLSLHPAGLAPRIANLAQWRAHLLERLRRQIDASGDPVLQSLLDELSSFPATNDLPAEAGTGDDAWAGLLVPMRLMVDGCLLSLFSTTTIFGTPVEVTLSELALESFFPADAATAEWLRRRHA
jgi:hypothetical protein